MSDDFDPRIGAWLASASDHLPPKQDRLVQVQAAAEQRHKQRRTASLVAGTAMLMATASVGGLIATGGPATVAATNEQSEVIGGIADEQVTPIEDDGDSSSSVVTEPPAGNSEFNAESAEESEELPTINEDEEGPLDVTEASVDDGSSTTTSDDGETSSTTTSDDGETSTTTTTSEDGETTTTTTKSEDGETSTTTTTTSQPWSPTTLPVPAKPDETGWNGPLGSGVLQQWYRGLEECARFFTMTEPEPGQPDTFQVCYTAASHADGWYIAHSDSPEVLFLHYGTTPLNLTSVWVTNANGERIDGSVSSYRWAVDVSGSFKPTTFHFRLTDSSTETVSIPAQARDNIVQRIIVARTVVGG